MRKTSILALTFCCLSLSPITAGRQDAGIALLMDEPFSQSLSGQFLPEQFLPGQSLHDEPLHDKTLLDETLLDETLLDRSSLEGSSLDGASIEEYSLDRASIDELSPGETLSSEILQDQSSGQLPDQSSEHLSNQASGKSLQENPEQQSVMPNPYDVSQPGHDAHDAHDARDARVIHDSPDLPSDLSSDMLLNQIRHVMANPYDQVRQIQDAQIADARKNSMAISALAREALSRQSRSHQFQPRQPVSNLSNLSSLSDQLNRSLNVNASPRIEITRLLQQPTKNDESLIFDLLNHEATKLEVERIPLVHDSTSEIPATVISSPNSHRTIPARTVILENWELLRDEHGMTVAGRINEPESRVFIQPGMILGTYGRVIALRDTPNAWYLVLENGIQIHGNPESDVIHARVDP